MKKTTPHSQGPGRRRRLPGARRVQPYRRRLQSSSMHHRREHHRDDDDGRRSSPTSSPTSSTGGAVFVDNATATITVRLINPNPLDGPSQFNDVVLTNYRVTYELPSGPGTPGTDVPLPFDGNFSTVLCQVGQGDLGAVRGRPRSGQARRPPQPARRHDDRPGVEGQDRDLRP